MTFLSFLCSTNGGFMPYSSAPPDPAYLDLLDAIDAVIYVADMETYELLFMNKLAPVLSVPMIAFSIRMVNRQNPMSGNFRIQ